MDQKASIADSIAASIEADRQLAVDAELARLRSEVATLKSRYKAALAQIDRERERSDALVSLKHMRAVHRPVTPVAKASKHSATMMLLISDVHCEETVRPETVSNANAFNLDICDARLLELQHRFLAMLEHERGLANIDRVVLWFGGDMISGMIHPELAEENSLHPLAAIRWIGERLRSFLDAVSDNAREVIVATSCGNHGRTTEKLRTNEADTSYEQHLYLTMRAAEARKNVRWHIGEGHLNYLDLDGFVLRFCHGHAVRYQGGIGGVHVPLKKAIAAWDTTQRADLTCIGHWHQFSAGNNYVTNGSVIGASAYSVRIKAEGRNNPCQAAIVIDHERNEMTKAYRIFCDRDLRHRSDSDAGSGDDHGDDRGREGAAGIRRQHRAGKRKPAGGGRSETRRSQASRRSR